MYTQTHTETMAEENALKTSSGKIQSRFGEISYDADKIIDFPNGILGMPGQTSFALAEMPVEKLQKFQVMQSLIDEDTSFAILSHDLMDEKIEQSDIDEIADILEFDRENITVILIASVKRTAEKSILTVNMRAPLFIDAEKKQGYQIVMTSNKYQVQHPLA